MDEYNVRLAGDTALIVDFGNRAEIGLSNKVLALAQRLNGLNLDGILETVPTTRSLSVYYEPTTISTAVIEKRISEIVSNLQNITAESRHWRVPVCYDPSLAPDLLEVAQRCQLSPAQLIELHSGQTYHAYMLGFLPGLAYLGDIPAALELPRRNSPRAQVPAGSVGMAGRMTTVFPIATPSGWHIIGRSPTVLWDPKTGAVLNAGDKVSFQTISLAEFDRLQHERARAVAKTPLTR